MKNVWIVNHYASHPLKHPQQKGRASLHLQIARELRGTEWKVQVVTASTSHPSGMQHLDGRVPTKLEVWDDTETLFVKSVPYNGTGPSRIINMASFGAAMFRPIVASQLERPSVVIGRITNPLAALASLRWARRYNVPFVLEISDIWPDSFIQLGAWRKDGLPAKGLSMVEKSLIKNSSAVMSPLPGLDKYLSESGFIDKPFFWVPNGTDTSLLGDGNGEPTIHRQPGLVFMYVGSLGHANAVDTLIQAFDRYVERDGGKDDRFVIVGSGALRDSLERMAASLPSGRQITFTGRIPHKEAISYSRSADALVANMRDVPIYQYGVALNKIFSYMLASRPVIFANNAMNDVVRDAGAGISVPADSVGHIADAMAAMSNVGEGTREAWGAAGREHVIANYTFRRSAERFQEMLESLSLC